MNNNQSTPYGSSAPNTKPLLVYALFGVVFGFLLSRSGATDYDAIANMFLLRDLHLVGIIGAAVAVAGPSLWWLRRRGIACPAGCSVVLKQKPRKVGNIAGSLLFGAGWAITGTCPGTALAQLGEGRLMALFTIGGILIGAGLHRRYGAGIEAQLAQLPTAPPPPDALDGGLAGEVR